MSEQSELEVVNLVAQPLSAEAFEPYGTILRPDAPLILEVDDGQTTAQIETLKYSPGPQRFTELASHFSYSQIFIPMEGLLGLILAPPPEDPATSIVDYDRLVAFAFEPGQIVMIYRGTFHMGGGIGGDTTYVTIKRTDQGELPSTSLDLRSYISDINIAERDGRVIEMSRGASE